MQQAKQKGQLTNDLNFEENQCIALPYTTANRTAPKALLVSKHNLTIVCALVHSIYNEYRNPVNLTQPYNPTALHYQLKGPELVICLENLLNPVLTNDEIKLLDIGITPNGNLYKLDSLLKWVDKHHTDPSTRSLLTTAQIYRLHRHQIAKMIHHHRDFQPAAEKIDIVFLDDLDATGLVTP